MRLSALLLLAFASPAVALEPKDVWLVVNKSVPESRQVADHYIAKRGVPKGNVVELDLPKGEDISRADYDTKLAGPLRDALKEQKEQVKVLVTTYGVPLPLPAPLNSRPSLPPLTRLPPRPKHTRQTRRAPGLFPFFPTQ